MSSYIQYWSVSVVHKYLNFATPSKDLFSIFMLCFCAAFLGDNNIYFVFSGFSSNPTSLLAYNIAPVFLYMVSMFSPKMMSSA
jgi:hypothetical protein